MFKGKIYMCIGCSKLNYIYRERESQKKYNAVEIEITVQKFTVIQKYCKSFLPMYVCIMYKSSFFKPRTSHLFTYGRTLTNHQNLITIPPFPMIWPSRNRHYQFANGMIMYIHLGYIVSCSLIDHVDLKAAF